MCWANWGEHGHPGWSLAKEGRESQEQPRNVGQEQPTKAALLGRLTESYHRLLLVVMSSLIAEYKEAKIQATGSLCTFKHANVYIVSVC